MNSLGEISAVISESEAFDYLDGPILRLAAEDIPVPYNQALETAMIKASLNFAVIERLVRNTLL
jgi:pyruvate dehydrogenase E1 component beta subunit